MKPSQLFELYGPTPNRFMTIALAEEVYVMVRELSPILWRGEITGWKVIYQVDDPDTGEIKRIEWNWKGDPEFDLSKHQDRAALAAPDHPAPVAETSTPAAESEHAQFVAAEMTPNNPLPIEPTRQQKLSEAYTLLEKAIELIESAVDGTSQENRAQSYIIPHLRDWLVNENCSIDSLMSEIEDEYQES